MAIAFSCHDCGTELHAGNSEHNKHFPCSRCGRPMACDRTAVLAEAWGQLHQSLYYLMAHTPVDRDELDGLLLKAVVQGRPDPDGLLRGLTELIKGR